MNKINGFLCCYFIYFHSKYCTELEVLVGTNDLKSGGTYYIPEGYIKHGNHGDFNSTFYNDIAVLEIIGEIEFNDNVQPIGIASEEVPEKTVATLIGWGRLGVSSFNCIFFRIYLKINHFNRLPSQSQEICKFLI